MLLGELKRREVNRMNNEDLFWKYQQDLGPLLKELARAAGGLAADQDRMALKWLRDHCIRLLDEAEKLLEAHPAGEGSETGGE
jgi:hypothetical protein